MFDVAGDCEDGAPIGGEAAHARMIAGLIASPTNRFDRFGARILRKNPGFKTSDDVAHAAWMTDVALLIGDAGYRSAVVTLPKAESTGDVERMIEALARETARRGITRQIPVSVLIETPGAVHDAWTIAALPNVASLDFGTLDFVSFHHGAIPISAMESPGQFDHAILRQAKTQVAAAALAHGVVPAHGVTRALDAPDVVYADARRCRRNGFKSV